MGQISELAGWMEPLMVMGPLQWTGVALVLLTPGVACVSVAKRLTGVRLLRQRGPAQRLERMDARLTQLCTAVSLLTDTTEESLRDALGEIERLSQAVSATPSGRRASMQRRVRHAAERGQSLHEIAVREGVSEGEVRLRLRLQREQAALTPATAGEV